MLKLGQEIMQFTEQFSIYYIFWKINKTFLKTKISKNCQNLFYNKHWKFQVQQERRSFKNCWNCKNFSTQNKKSSTDSQLRKLILYCAYTEPRLQINGSLNSRVWTILNSNIWNCVYWFDHANCFGTILFEVPMLLLNVFFINQSWKILLLNNS
jgi:hypothetical protein